MPTGEGPFIWHVHHVDTPHLKKVLSAPWSRHGDCLIGHQECRPCRHLLAAALKCKAVHGVFLPGVSENKGFLEHVHHKTYLAATYKEAMSDCRVSLVDIELLEPDGITKPTVDYTHAQRKKGKPSKRLPSRGEPSSSPPAGSKGRPRKAPDAPASPPGHASSSQLLLMQAPSALAPEAAPVPVPAPAPSPVRRCGTRANPAREA